MNPNIKRHLAILFLLLLIPLGAISVLGVWEVFDTETVNKSLLTLAVVAIFLTLAITILSFVDVEQAKPSKTKKQYNKFHHDE